MQENSNQLISEIRQIISQYKAEVPSKRGPWPQAIKKRVIELWSSGNSTATIAKLTGISYHTLLSWEEKFAGPSGTFKELPVVRKTSVPKNRTVTVKPRLARIEKRTVTVITPNGYRIEGLDVELLQSFIMGVEK